MLQAILGHKEAVKHWGCWSPSSECSDQLLWTSNKLENNHLHVLPDANKLSSDFWSAPRTLNRRLFSFSTLFSFSFFFYSKEEVMEGRKESCWWKQLGGLLYFTRLCLCPPSQLWRMRLGRLPPFNNNEITAACQEPLPFSIRGCSQPFEQVPRGRRNTWGTKVGREAPELHTSSEWGAFRVLPYVFSPLHPPLAMVRCRIPGGRVFFPSSSTINLSSTDWESCSTFNLCPLPPGFLLLAQLFGGKDECSFLVTGFTLHPFHIARSHCWIFPVTF